MQAITANEEASTSGFAVGEGSRYRILLLLEGRALMIPLYRDTVFLARRDQTCMQSRAPYTGHRATVLLKKSARNVVLSEYALVLRESRKRGQGFHLSAVEALEEAGYERKHLQPVRLKPEVVLERERSVIISFVHETKS